MKKILWSIILFFAGVGVAASFSFVIPYVHAQVPVYDGALGSTTVGTGACPFTWTQNLSQGQTSLDVEHLQQLLNIDPATTIAASGAGSPGQETQYFGALTFDAVERFQEKYAQNVLFPSGLKAPTGFVGPATRGWLNALCGVNL